MRIFLHEWVHRPDNLIDEANAIAHVIYVPELQQLENQWTEYANTQGRDMNNVSFMKGRNSIILSGSQFHSRTVSDALGIALFDQTLELWAEYKEVSAMMGNFISNFGVNKTEEILGFSVSGFHKPIFPKSEFLEESAVRQYLFANRRAVEKFQTLKARQLLKDLENTRVTFSELGYSLPAAISGGNQEKTVYKSLFSN